MAAACWIFAPEVAYAEYKRHITAHEFRTLQFSVTMVMDALARLAAIRTSGNTVRRVPMENESMRCFYHISQLYAERGTFLDYD